ncbi:twin-arginine translocation pathway signal protein [Pseudomonas rubra]|uniref:Twin-arginine translocation pathway signal protein n=1 Tax=Pseudomonas rubra TaxID=2942627 RepID=A0ABT5P6M0_9PSED|nr:twin-arginine translocation pathway signal protein [Pseudomonas rubra]MDD1013933.1 twin-arginine translocation pathway signal protein [Pseudomonas rubra]MDD1038867.1 twin-arginine translocation pathway signal protein [Pseudomonas rubra]MDD1154379.1 twin-arginine translocation pathway signal protein [Pseudomonas rubra]
MTTSLPVHPALSRRGLLKFSLGASALLATAGLGASLSGCSVQTPASGFICLRANDLLILQALIPVVLAGTQAADKRDALLLRLDNKLTALSPAMLKLTHQLFDVLAMAVTRGPLTGIWGSWDSASSAQIEAFLQRWQDSSLNLLRMGHASLLQLLHMAWYELPDAWAHCGYPGPPKV